MDVENIIVQEMGLSVIYESCFPYDFTLGFIGMYVCFLLSFLIFIECQYYYVNNQRTRRITNRLTTRKEKYGNLSLKSLLEICIKNWLFLCCQNNYKWSAYYQYIDLCNSENWPEIEAKPKFSHKAASKPSPIYIQGFFRFSRSV